MNSRTLLKTIAGVLIISPLFVSVAFASEISGTLSAGNTENSGSGFISGTVTGGGSGTLSGTVADTGGTLSGDVTNAASSNSSSGGGGGGGAAVLAFSGANPLPSGTGIEPIPQNQAPIFFSPVALGPSSIASNPTYSSPSTGGTAYMMSGTNDTGTTMESPTTGTDENPQMTPAAVAYAGIGLGGWLAVLAVIVLISGAGWLAWRASAEPY